MEQILFRQVIMNNGKHEFHYWDVNVLTKIKNIRPDDESVTIAHDQFVTTGENHENIFENDIVETRVGGEWDTYYVTYWKDHFRFVLQRGGIAGWTSITKGKCRLIGNKYDNPNMYKRLTQV